MVAGEHAVSAAPERPFPPITEIAVATMALIVAGGIYTAAYVPMSVSLTLPVILLAGAAILLAVNAVLLFRLREFAWHVFRQVFGYALLAYCVIAGMIGYVFVVDGTPTRVLVVLIGMLAVFAIDIPTLLGFSVARYQDPD